mmetsp:Transcript_7168/g.11660  ORF Transcript_7168/g.11660 Transcript_7168/m.11660 type:complete len:199 (-) Transcript_7168:281-877(-)
MSIEFRLLAVLYIVFQQTVRRAVGQNLGAGFCATGKCINCFSCNGECNLCECNTLSNSCCCQSPRGTYSTGYDQVPCPGGTYQSKVGSSSCLVCNQTNPSTLYWLTKTGAHSRLECQEALCDRYCDRLDEACRAANCVTGANVQSYMMALKRNETFCNRLNISFRSCSWIDWSGAFGGSLKWPFSLVAAILVRTLLLL